MRKRQIWLILSAGVAIFVSAGIIGYHRLQEPKQQIFAVTNQVLQAELALNPRESSKQLAVLDQHLVTGSQADFLLHGSTMKCGRLPGKTLLGWYPCT